MSQDRIVRWKNGIKPKRKELKRVIENFFGPVAVGIEWRSERFFVRLLGESTSPTKDVPILGAIEWAKFDPKEDRYIEVWPSRYCLYVMTRRADDFTNGCAQRLSEVLARNWLGDLENE